METVNLHGVYTADERGNWSLMSLYTEEASAQDEAKLTEVNGQQAIVMPVPVFTSEQSWRRIFRQGTGKE